MIEMRIKEFWKRYRLLIAILVLIYALFTIAMIFIAGDSQDEAFQYQVF
jgi:hypothetical protein